MQPPSIGWLLTFFLLSASCGRIDNCEGLKEEDYLLNEASEVEFKKDNIAFAIEMTNTIIKGNPKNFIAFSNRGTFKYNECVALDQITPEDKLSIYADILRSISLCPGYTRGYRNLISIAHDINDFETVITYSKLYIDRFADIEPLPHHSKILARYSFALHAEGKVKEAWKYSSLALQTLPVDNFAYVVRGKCYRDLGQYEEAMRDFDMAIKLYPAYFLAYHERGYCLKLQQRYREAEIDYLRALEIDSLRPEPNLGLGRIKVELGDTLAGCQYYYKSMKLNELKGFTLIINNKLLLDEIEKICLRTSEQ